MGIEHKTHWFGVALLFTATILLLIVSISAPIWAQLGLLTVTTSSGSGRAPTTYNFGTFGWCLLNQVAVAGYSTSFCTSKHIGYYPGYIMGVNNHSDGMTKVLILHPVACGVAFVAFLLAGGKGIFGHLAGALVALVAWILTLIALGVDFNLFGGLLHHINVYGSGRHASFGVAIWCVLAAFVCLFLGMVIVFFTWWQGREKMEGGEAWWKRLFSKKGDGDGGDGGGD